MRKEIKEFKDKRKVRVNYINQVRTKIANEQQRISKLFATSKTTFNNNIEHAATLYVDKVAAAVAKTLNTVEAAV